ncbi:MAG: hypothetical protein QG597_4001 [Actinomycetota bacterium]|nr:hypothetical protein [Actinomycetota bacterium]
MRVLLIVAIVATCGLAVAAAVISYTHDRPLLWRRVLGAIAVEYAAGVVLGCWAADAVLSPARTVLDHLLVRS